MHIVNKSVARYSIMMSVLSNLQCGPSTIYLTDLLNLTELDTTLLIEILEKRHREELEELLELAPTPEFKGPRNCNMHTDFMVRDLNEKYTDDDNLESNPVVSQFAAPCMSMVRKLDI